MNSDYFLIEEIEGKEIISNKPEVLKEGEIIEETEVARHSEKPNKLAKCPSCGTKSLKVEGGCHSCINEKCGYSKCDI